jgi:hypothetical protein
MRDHLLRLFGVLAVSSLAFVGPPDQARAAADGPVVLGQAWLAIDNGEEIDINGQVYRAQSTTRHKVAILATSTGDVIQFNVFPGDRWQDDHAYNERAELSGHPKPFPNDGELWISFGVVVEKGTASDGLDAYLGQLHQFPGEGDAPAEPPFLLHLTGKRLDVELRASTEAPLRVAPGPTVLYTDPEFPWGEWVNFVFHLNLDRTGQGFVRGWRNGVQIIDYKGNVGYASTSGVYWKFGSYRNAMASAYYGTRYANVEAGAKDLSERVEHPIPIQ